LSRRLLLYAVVALGLLALAPATPAMAANSTRISAGDSDFGRMIWAPRDQAIYMFEPDKRNKSRCYGRCAKEWPPVLTKGRPKAGRGVDADLLGTTKRRNGDRQVTYGGRPLYTYAHEGAGEVLCHDVRLNGGLWWVLSPDGEPRTSS
jgi:predicted lipoprotein with Yx(FWY)xxD motif